MKRAFITLMILMVLAMGATWWCVHTSAARPQNVDHPVVVASNDGAPPAAVPQEHTLTSYVTAYLAAPNDSGRKRQMIQAIAQVKGGSEHADDNDATIAALISVITVNKYIDDDQGPRGPRVLDISDLPPWSDLMPAVGALERIGAPAGPQLIRDALAQGGEMANIKRGLEEEAISKILPQAEINRLIDQMTINGTPPQKDQGASFKVAMGHYFSSAKQ